jgi:signal transduction histidine kinase
VEHETWRLRRDGTQFWASVVLTAMRNMNGDLVGFAEIIRDLTERRRAQEQAMQNERLAAIGEMVTGLAHESRNALQQIQACVEMLTRRLKTAPEIGLVTEIQKAHDRLFRLLEEVRGYAKPIKLERLPVDISKVWRQAWQQLAAQRNGSLAILEENVGDCSVNCLVDAFSIEQLFRNLFENSLAAANGALKVQVSCQPSHLDGQSAVRIRVADNGSGLTAEQKRRIFEPFYTTKSRGTGLGMAIAKRVVEAHGGRISVGELSGPGTAIDVTLPRGLS